MTVSDLVLKLITPFDIHIMKDGEVLAYGHVYTICSCYGNDVLNLKIDSIEFTSIGVTINV